MIAGNIITGNTGFYGGGVCCLGSSPTITHNLISGNSVGKTGGGIYCSNGSNPLIAYNGITGNKAAGDDCMGGGIDCNKSSPSIVNNTISNNASQGSSSRGGGICCFWNSCPTIIGNVITGNAADWSGGGVYIWRGESVPVVIHNNTFFGNTAKQGGGIYCGWSLPTVANSVFWNNAAAHGKEIWIGNVYYPSTFSISHSDVEGGKASVYVDSGSVLNWGAGIIDADPAFADPAAEDFHLTFASPCRNQGDDSAVLDSFDFESDPRIAEGTVDMGGDEFHAHLYYTGDATPGGEIKTKLVGLPGTFPTGLFLGSGILEPPLPTAWGDFYLQSPWYAYVLWPVPATGILVLTATLPGTPPAPYELPLQGMVGDALTNPCLVKVYF